MKTKIIPFDLETAKKIQAGEIKGKIKTRNGRDARVVCWDRCTDDKMPIVALVQEGNLIEASYFYTIHGELYKNANVCYYDLVLEVPDEQAEEPQFKPFDKVLVRENNKIPVKMSNGDECSLSLTTWTPAIYQRRIDGDTNYQYLASGILWRDCIPYEGHDYLVGTTDKPE